MKIGICDDSKEMRDILKNKIIEGNYIEEYEIQEFESAVEILQKEPKLELLFLDIEMPEMTGIELLRQYSWLFQHVKVVFLTSYMDYLEEGYEVKVYRYLGKPIQEEKLQKLFDSLKREEVMNQTLEVKCDGVMIRIPHRQIIYVVANNNYVDIVTHKGKFAYYKRFKDVENMFSKRFFYKTHRSFLVNLREIKERSQDGSTLIMTNGETVDVTKRNVKQFEKVYFEFLFNN